MRFYVKKHCSKGLAFLGVTVAKLSCFGLYTLIIVVCSKVTLPNSLTGKCQLELNTNLNGNDIGDGIEVDSWEACARLAAGTPGGKFWTWNEKGNKYCHVKSSDSGRMPYVGAKSGNIHCVK